MKSKFVEIQKAIEELAQKYFNEEGKNTKTVCNACPYKPLKGYVELKRHIVTNHLKGKYEHISDKINFCKEELTDANGSCKLCRKHQTANHFRLSHVTRLNFGRSILVKPKRKKVLPRSLESLNQNGISIRSVWNS